MVAHHEVHEDREVYDIEFDELSHRVIGLAIAVHKELGPGLLESAYESCLSYELLQAGIPFQRQVEVELDYKGQQVGMGFRADLIVDGALLLELKSCNRLERIHEAQVLTYLKLTGLRTGLLINFNVQLLRKGLRRFVL